MDFLCCYLTKRRCCAENHCDELRRTRRLFLHSPIVTYAVTYSTDVRVCLPFCCLGIAARQSIWCSSHSCRLRSKIFETFVLSYLFLLLGLVVFFSLPFSFFFISSLIACFILAFVCPYSSSGSCFSPTPLFGCFSFLFGAPSSAFIINSFYISSGFCLSTSEQLQRSWLDKWFITFKWDLEGSIAKAP